MAPAAAFSRRICDRRSSRERNVTTGEAESSKDPAEMEGVAVPAHFRCPISLDLMKDPVTAATGITYDRRGIETWLDMGNAACPVTNHHISAADLIPNHALRRMIQDWCVANRSLGVDRIPTPRIPLSKADAIRILSEITSAARIRDTRLALQLVVKIRDLAMESERNRRCISSNGGACALASLLDAFSQSPAVVGEALTALPMTAPLDGEACRLLSSPESLRSIVWVLRNGEPAGRVNAAVVVGELAHPASGTGRAVATGDGCMEAVVRVVREAPAAGATKAGLVACLHVISGGKSGAERLVELGMVGVALEVLADAERSVAEKALGVVDGLCGTEAGRREARGHALAVAVLVKKLLRVSEIATQLAVSALWRLCRERAGERCLAEAAQVGAFHKLLLVLQLGCGDVTKEKVKKLLKLLHPCRSRNHPCLHSTPFQNLQTTF